MLLGNILINLGLGSKDPITGKINFYSLIQGNNIFMTLAVFIVLLILLENIKNKHKTKTSIALFVLFSAFSILFTEGGMELYLVLLITYYYNKKISLSILVLSFLRLVIAIFKYFSGSTGASFIASMSFHSSWAMVFVIIPILLYNNKRGRNDSFAKWLFYIIYPLHLWILKIVAMLFVFNY